MDLTDKRVAIIGLGLTGMATARFLARRGARLTLTDERPAALSGEALADLAPLPPNMNILPCGREVLSGADLVIPSPGVYPNHPILSEALHRGIPVLSELELAGRFVKTPLVAITGTNGKTTVTSLIGEILRAAGKTVFVGGNIGAPLIGYADSPQEADWAVVEVSTFQLQWATTFAPRIALLLNVTSDHLDYHGSFEAYRRVKASIFARQGAGDLAILNADDPFTAVLAESLAARTECFSTSRAVAQGITLAGERLVNRRDTGAAEEYPLAMIHLPGRHNIENVMAALLAARACGCEPEAIRCAVSAFRGIAHRIEFVGEKRGVRFYDDSKGTNVGAVVRAIESFSQPIVLLLGGRDKEGDFATLIPLLRRCARVTILFGEAAEKINGLLGGAVETLLAATLKEAMQKAAAVACPGDIVLLSPGCASFDEFCDYKHRGRVFQELVEELEP